MMQEKLDQVIPEDLAGVRLDLALVELFPDFSRARLQHWVKNGQIRVNGETWRSKDKVAGGENVALQYEPENAVETFQPESIPLDIVFEDDHLLVLNKPPGLVVHPGAGNWSGTLLNALLYRFPELQSIPRAGIVHRLDKQTSGLMVVARTLQAHKSLVDALQLRDVSREYIALVEGKLIAGGCVEEPIGRHPVERKRMAVRENGKPAVTHYRINKRYQSHTLLDVKLETGRTHQIRVHMAHIHHSIVGDPVYGNRRRVPKGMKEADLLALRGFRRQALHAKRLGLVHPGSGEAVSWEAPIPDDYTELLSMLEGYT
jgi:23S rRNA pseudouridine1911/1915/1917 synthase